MDFFRHLTRIETALREAGFTANADDLLDRKLAFGTAAEVLSSSCSRLVGLKIQKPEAYAAVSVQAEELLVYARSLGYGPFIATYPDAN